MRRSFCITVMLVLMGGWSVTSAAPAHADATVVEISCSQSPGLVIDAPGTYRLRRSVSNCGSSPAVLIDAPNVIFGLDKHVIDGTDAAGADAIVVTQKGARVGGGTVSDWRTGVDGTDSPGIVVRSLHAASNGVGVRAGDRGIIKNSRFEHNGFEAVIAGDGATVAGNTFSFNGLTPVNPLFDEGSCSVLVTDHARIADNQIRNGFSGICARDDNRIDGNVVTDGDGGFSFNEGNLVISNRATRNRAGFTFGRTNDIVDNSATSSGYYGFIGIGPGTILKRNEALANGGAGIQLEMPFDGTSFCSPISATIVNNTAARNGYRYANEPEGRDSGIVVVGSVDVTTSRIEDNKVTGNARKGIAVPCGTVPRDGSIPGAGSNYARGNVAVPQCDERLCQRGI